MIALLLLHAVVGAGIMLAGKRMGRRALLVGGVAPLVSLLWLAAQWADVTDGQTVTESFVWVEPLGLTIDLRLDGFSALMMLLVTGIGVLVFAYGLRYFPRQASDQAKLIGLLTLFAGAMLGLVVADNLFVLYLFWELTGVTSYFLIGNKHTDGRARAAALQALLVTGAGALAMLGGFVVIGSAAGTYQISAMLADPPSGTAVTVALVLVLLGAMTKSAQYPFHSWLPGAMVAPTPVSAYLHSATMVTAGVYLVARFTPAFADVGFWRPAVVIVGLVTMIGGGLRALRQSDLKLLLAFGTVSQLGFMFVLFGMGTPGTEVAGSALLVGHALFKAALFMSVGVLDHQLGTRDIGELPRLGREWLGFKVITIISAASMAAIPLTFGYIDKEEAYAALTERSPVGGSLAVALVVLASMLTVAYSARVVWGAFWAPAELGAPEAPPDRRPPFWFVAPPMVLAALSLVLGIVPMAADELITVGAQALDEQVETVSLALWHGIDAAFLLSLVTFTGGALLFALHRPLARVLATGSRLPNGAELYLQSLRGMNMFADRVTGIVQNGSLPVYAGVILITAVVLPGFALATGLPFPELPPFTEGPAQVGLAALLIGAAVGAAAVRRRFAAALFLGVVGYGMAGLFVSQGAPDLALTQIAVETLTLVLFVLVLRRLPDRFERETGALGRGVRMAVAAVVGAVVFFFAIYAADERVTPPVSEEMVARSLPEGQGRNVVNVILVDFRGLDTLGEITVLAAAAIGAVALARAGRKPGAPAPAGPASPKVSNEQVNA
jgi:multicomponent Na+:H+ antiporter subunit A